MQVESKNAKKRQARRGRKPRPAPKGFDVLLVGVSRAQIARLFGVHANTIDHWCIEGMPRRGDGDFDLAAVCRWLRAGAVLGAKLAAKATKADAGDGGQT